MKINDYNGEIIIITDLDKAIEQAKMFKDFRHVCGNYKKLVKKLKRYWSDIYFKLMKLKENGESPGNVF